MPRSGGATQPAILPGSTTFFISERTKARSASEGIQSYSFLSYSSRPSGFPSGATDCPAQMPMDLRKREEGSDRRSAWPARSICRFQRLRPISQSLR